VQALVGHLTVFAACDLVGGFTLFFASISQECSVQELDVMNAFTTQGYVEHIVVI
jgi:hypothetical protein